MTLRKHKIGAIAVVTVGSALFAIAGCGSDDGANPGAELASIPANEDALHHSHDYRPGRHTAGAGGATGASGSSTGSATGTGGTVGTGGATVSSSATCDICTKANDCCLSVGGGPLCTYSAQTCVSVAPASRDPYINTCMTLISAVWNAWSANPPDACK